MNFRNHAFRTDACGGHASSSRRSEHEGDGLDARRDFRPRNADRRSASAGSAYSAVSTVASALPRLSARVGSVRSGAAKSAFAAKLSRCALAAGSTVASAPHLEQRRFDSHAAVVGNHGERAAATAAGFAAAAAATGETARAAATADTERDDEVTTAWRFAAGTADSGAPRLSVPSRIAGIAGEVTSELDPAELEKRRRAGSTVGALYDLCE